MTVAFPGLLNDKNVKSVLECNGSIVLAFQKDFKSRLLFDKIFPFFQCVIFRRAAIRDNREAVERMIAMGLSPRLLEYPLRRAMRLGLHDQVEWMRTIARGQLDHVETLKAFSPEQAADLLKELCDSGLIYRDDKATRAILSGVDVNATIPDNDNNQRSLLGKKLWSGDFHAARLLILVGAEVDGALLHVTACGWIENTYILKLLISAGADVNVIGKVYRRDTTPLIQAADKGLLQMAYTLLEAGADPQLSDPYYGQTALDCAIEKQNELMSKLLLSFTRDEKDYAEIERVLNTDRLHKAVEWNNLKTVNKILKSGAYYIDGKAHRGKTAIMNCRDVEMFHKLVEAGADIHVKDKRGATVLMYAASHGSVELVKTLIFAGVDVKAVDYLKSTALHEAVGGKQDWDDTAAKIMQVLLDHGADISAQNSIGCTALFEAAGRHNVWAVRLLLERGADVKHQTRSGETALTMALSSRRTLFRHPYFMAQTIKALIEGGANVDAIRGSSAYEKAIQEGDPKIIQLLTNTCNNNTETCNQTEEQDNKSKKKKKKKKKKGKKKKHRRRH